MPGGKSRYCRDYERGRCIHVWHPFPILRCPFYKKDFCPLTSMGSYPPMNREGRGNIEITQKGG